MIEKIIENVINQMIPHLDQGQLEHLNNVLYVNFHGLELQEQCTELVPKRPGGRCGQNKDVCSLEKGGKLAGWHAKAVYQGAL